MTTAQAERADCLALVRSEFLEMPGLCLTQEQVQRLWGLDREQSKMLLQALVDASFLRRTEDGMFARIDVARCHTPIDWEFSG